MKRRRLGQPGASESTAARSSAAGQPSAETVLGRAAVSGEQERHEPPQRSTGASERRDGAGLCRGQRRAESARADARTTGVSDDVAYIAH